MTSLKELSDNPDIVIKNAYKDSAVVVMNTTNYLREGYRQLSDDKFYTKLPHDPTEKVVQSVRNMLSKIK